MRDSLYDDVTARLTLAPAIRTNGTVTGTAVDTAAGGGPFRTAMLVVSAGVVTDGSNAVTVEDSDDGSTNWQPFAGQSQGSIPALATAQGNATYRMALDTIPRRWLRAKIVTSGATTGGAIGAIFVLSSGPGAPVS
jgi:hypothetical protein